MVYGKSRNASSLFRHRNYPAAGRVVAQQARLGARMDNSRGVLMLAGTRPPRAPGGPQGRGFTCALACLCSIQTTPQNFLLSHSSITVATDRRGHTLRATTLARYFHQISSVSPLKEQILQFTEMVVCLLQPRRFLQRQH